jgi:hypothetical protein
VIEALGLWAHGSPAAGSGCVIIAEGEKDLETLRGHGFVAITNAFGADAPWLPQYTL